MDGQRMAPMLAKLVGGIKPAEMPIEQPTKFELVVNLTAKTLGLNTPHCVSLRG
jgi:putative tryptophan/tyrosine transport system substrate-binding protein